MQPWVTTSSHTLYKTWEFFNSDLFVKYFFDSLYIIDQHSTMNLKSLAGKVAVVTGEGICIWHCFECEMGLSQHKSPKSLKARERSETSIFSHDLRCFVQF